MSRDSLWSSIISSSMASTSVVVVKVVADVVVLVTDVVVSSGMSATFTQGVTAIGFQIDAKSKRSDWWKAPSHQHHFETPSEFSIQSNPSSIKPFPSPSKITLKSFQIFSRIDVIQHHLESSATAMMERTTTCTPKTGLIFHLVPACLNHYQ